MRAGKSSVPRGLGPKFLEMAMVLLMKIRLTPEVISRRCQRALIPNSMLKGTQLLLWAR